MIFIVILRYKYFIHEINKMDIDHNDGNESDAYVDDDVHNNKTDDVLMIDQD